MDHSLIQARVKMGYQEEGNKTLGRVVKTLEVEHQVTEVGIPHHKHKI
jgi:hypothetical protein